MRDEESAQLVARSGIAVGIAALSTANPVMGLAAAAVGPALELAVEKWREQVARRSAQTMAAAAAVSGLGVDDVIDRLIAMPEGIPLLAEALNAAARTTLEAKVDALGRSLGNLASDPAVVDSESIWVRILADIEPAHLRVMLHLAADHPQRPGHMNYLRAQDLEPVTGSSSIAFVILQTLIRHGLAEVVDKEAMSSQARGHYRVIAGVAEPILYSQGRLTDECINRLHARGGAPT
ncbi:hypothetical protein [Pedococcus soli]